MLKDQTCYGYRFVSHKVFSLAVIIVMILAVNLSCILGYEEVITFNRNYTYNLDNCSRIMWYPDIFEGNSTPPALRSGPIRNSGISCVKKTVEGPANIDFLWKIDQEKDRIGELSFNVDNETILICPSSSWSPAFYAVSSGDHTLSWEYRKWYSYPEFKGVGWIDDIKIIYENRSSLISKEHEDYAFEQQLASIEKNMSVIKGQLASINSKQKITEKNVSLQLELIRRNISKVSSGFMENTTKGIVEKQLDSLKDNLSMIEKGLESLGNLQNLTNGIIFIYNSQNLNLTKEINKYTRKIIILDDGIYFTNGLIISTNDVFIRPITKWGAILDGNGSRNTVKINNAKNITIDSLSIINSNCTIRVDNSNNIQISNNLISGFKYYGITLNNSSNNLIKFNRLTANYCNDYEAIRLLNSSENIALYNDIELPSCAAPSTLRLYVLKNSSGNSIQSANKGYIQENGILCRIYENNQYKCNLENTVIPVSMENVTLNRWNFLAYERRD